jgi:uncharacterized protein
VKTLLLTLIRLYQRHVSPRKGFACAYRVHTGCASCSHLGYRAIRRYGVWQGLDVLQARLTRCGVAHRRYAAMHPPSQPRAHQRRLAQAGFCDVGCDVPLDCWPSDPFGCVAECASSCGGGDCGNWDSRKKSKNQDKYIYIPPMSDRKHVTGSVL